MRILIIEDEKPAAQKLQKAISRKMNAEVLGVFGSVEESVNWLEQNAHPDLIFMDIQLSDGISFKIFDRVEIRCPVIFTTAFDDYWQKAFECNSIDYLLKPVKQEKLEIALSKYESLRQHFSQHFQQLLNWQHQPATPAFKKRFLIKRGADYISLRVEDLAYFYAAHKVVCLVDKQGQKYVMDESLADIEKQIDPSIFYRINRKYLVHQSSIKRIRVYPKSKLQIELEPAVQEEIIMSQENVSAFKAWMSD